MESTEIRTCRHCHSDNRVVLWKLSQAVCGRCGQKFIGTYYEIFALSQSASATEIKQAYRKLALRWHPDRHAGSDEAYRVFRLLREAYSVLSEETRRVAYDATLEAELPRVDKQASASPASAGSGGGASAGRSTAERSWTSASRSSARSSASRSSERASDTASGKSSERSSNRSAKSSARPKNASPAPTVSQDMAFQVLSFALLFTTAAVSLMIWLVHRVNHPTLGWMLLTIGLSLGSLSLIRLIHYALTGQSLSGQILSRVSSIRIEGTWFSARNTAKR